MIKHKKWTKEEDLVIFSQVRANPQNLQQAFRNVSELTERSVTAISYRWYNVLSVKKDKKNSIFFTMSRNNINRNRKNSNSLIDKTPFWKEILKKVFRHG